MYISYKWNIMFCYKSIRKLLILKQGISSDSIDLSIRVFFQIPQDKEFELYDEEGNKLGITPSLTSKIIYVSIINVEPTDIIENVKKNKYTQVQVFF